MCLQHNSSNMCKVYLLKQSRFAGKSFYFENAIFLKFVIMLHFYIKEVSTYIEVYFQCIF